MFISMGVLFSLHPRPHSTPFRLGLYQAEDRILLWERLMRSRADAQGRKLVPTAFLGPNKSPSSVVVLLTFQRLSVQFR